MITNAKSYYDFMSEITPADIYSGLLAHGMFSDKLPLCLHQNRSMIMYKPIPLHSKASLINTCITRICETSMFHVR